MQDVKENYKLMFTTYPDVVNIEQMKSMLGIGITLAYRLLKTRQIKSIKIGREYRIPKGNVISYLMNKD